VIRVLLAGHTGVVSGAELVTLELARDIPEGFEPIIACPPGPFADAANAIGVEVRSLPGTSGSLRLHPLHTPRAVLDLVRMGVALRMLARDLGAGLLHAVSLRAGIGAALARRLGGPPVVLAQHDELPASRISRILRATVDPSVSAIIANSAYTRDSLAAGSFRSPMTVVNPAVDLERFDPDHVDRDDARTALGALPSDFVLGVVGQITPWKGQALAIRALAEVRKRHPEARLVIAGETRFTSSATRYDNRSYRDGLETLVGDLGLGGAVDFVGQSDEVPALMRALDVLLVPSWHEPFGRVVIEGMAMGLPVVATSVGGPAETIADGRDGLLLPPRDEAIWAHALCELLESPQRRAQIGAAAKHTARQYDSRGQAEATAAVYRNVLAGRWLK